MHYLGLDFGTQGLKGVILFVLFFVCGCRGTSPCLSGNEKLTPGASVKPVASVPRADLMECEKLTPQSWLDSLKGPYKSELEHKGDFTYTQFHESNVEWAFEAAPAEFAGTAGNELNLWVKTKHGWAGPFNFYGRRGAGDLKAKRLDAHGLPWFCQTSAGSGEMFWRHCTCVPGGFKNTTVLTPASEATAFGSTGQMFLGAFDPDDAALIACLDHPSTEQLIRADIDSTPFLGLIHKWYLLERKPNTPVLLVSHPLKTTDISYEIDTSISYFWRFSPSQGYIRIRVEKGPVPGTSR